MKVLIALLSVCGLTSAGILYPRDSEFRELKELNGVWSFVLSPQFDQDIGFRDQWYTKPLRQSTSDVIPMAVPSSYNDVTQNKTIRDCVGWVWYEKEFYVPSGWSADSQRVFLRFGSAHYETRVFLNGESVLNHTGGHLPFVGEVTDYLQYNSVNRLTVALNSTLTQETIPQGTITVINDTSQYPPGYISQTYNFDFFNYAGIHRPVYLYTTPDSYIDDITITTDIDGTNGVVNYNVSVAGGSSSTLTVSLNVYDRNNTLVAQGTDNVGSITVSNANLWWPNTMSDDPGYMYTLEITLSTDGTASDVYRQPFGIRTVTWNNTSLMINGRPFYMRGFGRHEDSDIRGKGLDYPLVLKDFNLLKWIGANSFRTSHYPYAEEIMDQADRQGIAIVDECPAVGLSGFDNTLLQHHLQSLTELVNRDKNRPSVIIWSLSNEPQSYDPASGPYFQSVVGHVHGMDLTRPVTLVSNQDYNTDYATQYVDVIAVNRYYAWYSDIGSTEVIQIQLVNDITNWHTTFNKPVWISEYGAETIAGLHRSPEFVFTEDYQVVFMREYFKAFDTLRAKGFFVGEMIWNFADFLTPQEDFRPLGCDKGVFTRQRQPKASAHVLRRRYWMLSRNEGRQLPSDLRLEVMDSCASYGFHCEI